MENFKEINEKTIKEAFENIGIEIKNKDGTFRDSLDILKDLADFWEENIKGGDVNNEDYN